MSTPSDSEMDQVLVIAKKILNSKVEDKPKHFSDIYSNFKKRYPMLYDMCCEKDFDITHLEYMVKMIKSMNAGSFDNETASKEVGQKMFDHFVSPILQKTDESKK